MKFRLTALAAGLAALNAAPTLAQDEEAAKVWKATAELGMIVTSGNTETTTFQGKMDATQDLEMWKNQYVISALFKEDEITQADGTKETEKIAEKISGSVKSAYKLNKDNANLFIFGSHTDDKFGAYTKYSTLAVGYGDRLFETDTMQLDVEIGPGYYWSEQELDDGTTVEEDGAIVRAAAQYDWQVTESADFQQTLAVESGQDNTRTVSDTSLSARINGSMQMKVGFTVQSDSDVAEDKEKTDTTTYVTLVYKF
jgi:putative salt-induced outer membrane protein YdiY